MLNRFAQQDDPQKRDSQTYLGNLLGSLPLEPEVRNAVEQALSPYVMLDGLIDTVSALLAHATVAQIPATIQHALATIGQTLNVDRAFAFWIDQANDSLAEVYEWCQPHAESLRTHLIGLPLAGFTWSLPKLRQFEPLCIMDVAQMPAEAAVEAAQMALHGTTAFACIPFRQGQTLLGWLSLEVIGREQAWPSLLLARLHVLADLLGHVLARREMVLANEEAELGLKKLNRELTTAVASKDQFLANMSHELRTPLHTVLLKAEMLQKAIYGPLTEKQQKSVAVIENSGRHLLSLINDILDLSKISAGRDDLAIMDIDVQLLCEATLQLIRQLAADKRQELVLTIDPDVVILQGDELRLKQILVNLLSNSIKFTAEEGRIGLDIVGDVAQACVYLTVWDTGIGIAPEVLPSIFEPFKQAEEGRRHQLAGTGLGLALVKRLVDLHEGTVAVESVLGEGSRFMVRLPWQGNEHGRGKTAVSPPADSEAQTPTQETQAAERPLILLAEDNETLVATLLDFFDLYPYEVAVAANGLQVLDALEKRVPDVILMDVQMPYMNGIETTERIRASQHHAHIPVVMVTAMAMPGDEERCFAAGATAYLSKPLNLMKLVDTIEQQLALT